MYIRRKVFSKLQTEDGQERYFSTTEFTLMSEAEQREFSRRSNLKDDLKKALKDGDVEKVMKLEKKTTRKGKLIGAGSALGLGTADMLLHKDKIKEAYKKAETNSREDKALLSSTLGLTSGLVGGVGAGIGHAVGKAKFNKALKKAKKELQEEKEEKSNSKKADKKCC